MRYEVGWRAARGGLLGQGQSHTKVAQRLQCFLSRRSIHRMSKLFVPTLRDEQLEGSDEKSQSVRMMIKAGLIRQSSAGIFTYLPMGQRIIERITKIIEEEMQALGASKLSMPHLLRADLWKKTGRWSKAQSELFTLKDRKETDFLLGPTFEEEVTALVAKEVHSYKQLPLFLYQIGTKYRDEARPRLGLLRSREFIMKDLYTFDDCKANAIESYKVVGHAYSRIFTRLGVPYLIAEADSGQIGGDMSHEYHYPSSLGQDSILTCARCHYAASDEKAVSRFPETHRHASSLEEAYVELFRVSDRDQSCLVVLSRDQRLNPAKISSFLSQLGRNDSTPVLVDESASHLDEDELMVMLQSSYPHLMLDSDLKPGDFRKAVAEDLCPNCSNLLSASLAIEVGHTFYLGQKYSMPLGALVQGPNDSSRTGVEMCCFGIGISRIMGAIAEINHDAKGFLWPVTVAPFKICVLFASREHEHRAATALEALYTAFSDDLVLEDRYVLGFGHRFKDAELQGYPLTVIVGKHFDTMSQVELHDRRTGERRATSLDDLVATCKAIMQDATIT